MTLANPDPDTRLLLVTRDHARLLYQALCEYMIDAELCDHDWSDLVDLRRRLRELRNR